MDDKKGIGYSKLQKIRQDIFDELQEEISVPVSIGFLSLVEARVQSFLFAQQIVLEKENDFKKADKPLTKRK